MKLVTVSNISSLVSEQLQNIVMGGKDYEVTVDFPRFGTKINSFFCKINPG